MREISPAKSMSADDFLALKSSKVQEIVKTIRKEKEAGNRQVPSDKLIDKSEVLTKEQRKILLDKTALLVDENLFGRSEMCIQFALLLDKALKYFDIDSNCMQGTAIYFDDDRREIYRWKHSWIRIGNEVIDGNTDILFENPMIPKSVAVAPYWGPVPQIPKDRRLRETHNERFPKDEDIENIWWPDMLKYLEAKYPKNA